MQIDRLFQMVYLLMERGTMTSAELAERFEVSPRTVLRDVDVLSAAGVPVYTTQGKGGGIAIMEGFVLNKAALTQEERSQILLALQSIRASGQPKAEETLAKVGALFHTPEPDWIQVDFSRWGQGVKDNRRFTLLRTAILERREITFDYAGPGSHSSRCVYPLRLVFKAKNWYLQGWCLTRLDYRTFKTNRMLRVEQSHRQFPAGVYTPPPIDKDVTTARPVLLELEVSPRVVSRMYDEFDEDCIRQGEGTYYVSANIPEDDWLYSFLLSLGREARVVGPPHVVEELENRRGKT